MTAERICAIHRSQRPGLNTRSAGRRRDRARGVRYLAAQTAAHAGIVDVRDGIGAQRVGVRLDRERWASRQANA